MYTFFDLDRKFLGIRCRYASGLVNACAALVLGWGVDRYNWPRTYVLAAASLLLTGMYILEVSHPSVTRTPVLCIKIFEAQRQSGFL